MMESWLKKFNIMASIDRKGHFDESPEDKFGWWVGEFAGASPFNQNIDMFRASIALLASEDQAAEILP
jgi:hypothetical protein